MFDEDFLVWNWPIAAELGTWNDADGVSLTWNDLAGASVAGFIVEYSPLESPKEDDRVTAGAKNPGE